jgi:hypothetical protein
LHWFNEKDGGRTNQHFVLIGKDWRLTDERLNDIRVQRDLKKDSIIITNEM